MHQPVCLKVNMASFFAKQVLYKKHKKTIGETWEALRSYQDMLQVGLEPVSMEWAPRLSGSRAHVLIVAPSWNHILTIVFPYKSAPPLTRRVWECPTAAQLHSEPPPPSAPSWHPHQWDYNDHFWWTQHLHMGKKHVLTKLLHFRDKRLSCRSSLWKICLHIYTNNKYSECPTSLLIWYSLPIWQCVLQTSIAIDQVSLASCNFWKVNLKNCDTSKGSFWMQPEKQRVKPCS